MSHYTVAVFTKTGLDEVDDLLAPFDEAIVVDPYVSHTKAELIQKERKRMQNAFEGPYSRWQLDTALYESRSNPVHIAYLKSLPDLLKQTDEQVYQTAIEGYEPEFITADGSMLSTYNPKSKWDWYEIGGRWTGMLVLKDGCTGIRGTPGLMMEASEDYDSAAAADVDFDAISESYRLGLMPYTEFMACLAFDEQYKRERYPTEEEYLRCQMAFSTYAVVTPDGEWHAPGNMGWFGISSSLPAQERDWQLYYYDRFIAPAITNGWFITIVDCHI